MLLLVRALEKRLVHTERIRKGIFRVHQFEKIEQIVFSKPEDSWKEYEKMIGITEEFFQKLEIPHRVVLLSSGDMGKISAKTYDLEVWMAGQNAYREAGFMLKLPRLSI